MSGLAKSKPASDATAPGFTQLSDLSFQRGNQIGRFIAPSGSCLRLYFQAARAPHGKNSYPGPTRLTREPPHLQPNGWSQAFASLGFHFDRMKPSFPLGS